MSKPKPIGNEPLATLAAVFDELQRDLDALHFAEPVAFVYNPLD